MTTYPAGTRIWYLNMGKDGRKTLNRPNGQHSGIIDRPRGPRGVFVKWDDGHRGSVLWGWIDDKPPHRAPLQSNDS